jgi:hypothetical protein
MEEMKCMLAHYEQCVEKSISEQTRKHDEDLKAMKQSQATTKNLSMTHNPPGLSATRRQNTARI